MTIRLSLRKRAKKLIANSKGFSSVIGTTFMVLVMLFLSTSVFMWTLSQNTTYNEAVKARNQEEADRRNENVVALGGNYSVLGNDVTVKVILRNAGSVAVQIINLWVLNTDLNRTYNHTSLHLNLNPGDVWPLVETVTILGANTNDTFVSWLVTARGNTVPLEKEQGIIVAQVSQGIGLIGMEFYDFKYYNVSEVGELEPYPNGAQGFIVPPDQNIAFRVTLTNFDQDKRTIQLNSHAVLWMLFPATPQQPRSAWWYIVNVDANGTIAPTFTPINLQYGESTQVFFASSTDGVFSLSFIKGSWINHQPGAVNLMLVGTIEGYSYGQNVPFVSIYVT